MYNIRNSWNKGMDSALQGVSQGNVNIGIFQETKVTGEILEWESSRYQVTAVEAPSPHHGGIAVFHQKAENFFFEAPCIHVRNIASSQMVMGQQGWHDSGCYITPNDELTIEDVVAAINRWT